MLRRLALPLMALAVIAVSSLMMAQPASAAEPVSIGKFGQWEAWEMQDEGGGKVCYMLARPTKHEGAYKSRDKIYALITHRPAEGSKNVFSYIAGYTYRDKSEAKLKIGTQVFNLFTQAETAWAPDANTDNQITEALRKGSSMVVNGTSARGTATVDTFSLKGSGDAHDAIGKACGL